MIRFQDLKVGDYVLTEHEGTFRPGTITDLNIGNKQVCVDNGVQPFWYEMEMISPIPLNDEQLNRLQFHREVQPNGNVKYSKGAFRMLIPAEGDFSKMELWYRDEKRHITQPLHLHQLQNHFAEMTKVPLDETNFD